MPEKFGRRYEIQILNPDKERIDIEPPFSVKFSIIRNVLASVNKCNLTIFNLAPKTRNKLFKDRYTIHEYWQIIIRAGYEKLSTVFQGSIYETISFKQGTEWISQVDAFDGENGVRNGYITETIQKDTDKKTIYKKIISEMPTLIEGVLAGPTGTSPRGKILMGNSSKVLQEESNNRYFIDNERVNILNPDEYIGGDVIVLDGNQLFTTPKRRDTFIDVDMLFFPEVQVGIVAEIRSTEEIYNGQYKVLGFKHDVTISEAMSGQAKSSISLDSGALGLKEVN